MSFRLTRAMSSAGNFFSSVFGFDESKYATTQRTLNAMLTTTGETVWGNPVMAFRVGDGEDGLRRIGAFETPSVRELRLRAGKELEALSTEEREALRGQTKATNVVGESGALHRDPSNEGCVFQAASQFNYLEFPSPNCCPEQGILQYVYDKTQGPACAIACPFGTAYRNYLVQMPDGTTGQTAENQLDGLSDVTAQLARLRDGVSFYVVKNGYIDGRENDLKTLSTFLSDERKAAELRDLLRIGVQWNTQTDVGHVVTQTYNSACSVGYSRHASPEAWRPFATLVLEGTYEATMWVAVLANIERVRAGKAPQPVQLTKVGGGVFGNDAAWIMQALEHARGVIDKAGVALDLRIVHFREIEDDYTAVPELRK
eukprot:PhM_4_TR16418/c0_g1_i1/m.48792